MTDIRAKSLIKRYSSSSASKSGGKEMDVAGRGNRESAMRAGGKPKNIRKTVSRLLGFLAKEKLRSPLSDNPTNASVVKTFASSTRPSVDILFSTSTSFKKAPCISDPTFPIKAVFLPNATA